MVFHRRDAIRRPDRELDTLLDYEEIERELRASRPRSARRLGLTRSRSSTGTIPTRRSSREQIARHDHPVGGLTLAHDTSAHRRARGPRLQGADARLPDIESLQFGKEFGNRGQCNPTYFTVGNLVKHLVEAARREGHARRRHHRDARVPHGGACGPCRFGTYVTEYRKALRDAGFDGFRVLLFQQPGGLQQATGKERARDQRAILHGGVQALIAGDCSTSPATASGRTSRAGETDARSRSASELAARRARTRGSVAWRSCSAGGGSTA